MYVLYVKIICYLTLLDEKKYIQLLGGTNVIALHENLIFHTPSYNITHNARILKMRIHLPPHGSHKSYLFDSNI
jgi:hypothetical protein